MVTTSLLPLSEHGQNLGVFRFFLRHWLRIETDDRFTRVLMGERSSASAVRWLAGLVRHQDIILAVFGF